MRQAIAFIALAASLALAAAGCGGSDEPSEESATVEWADGFCTAITTWSDELKQATAELTSPSQDSLDQAANDVRTSTQQLVDDLKSLGAPDTESGQEVKDALDELATTLDDGDAEIEEATEGVSGLTDLPAAITTITTTLSAMGTAFSSTFQTIEDADVKGELQDAFEQADSCSDIAGSNDS